MQYNDKSIARGAHLYMSLNFSFLKKVVFFKLFLKYS